MKNQTFFNILIIIIIVLFIPFIAMQFTDTVNWGLFDFVIAAVLLFGVGYLANCGIIKVKSKNRRIVLLIFIALLFILLWAELAVGIFGTIFSGK